MAQLRTGQIIYTRLESKYSPNRISEYQVGFASPWLTPDQVKLTEEKIRVFDLSDPSIVRKQFFLLPDGSFVMSRSQVMIALVVQGFSSPTR